MGAWHWTRNAFMCADTKFRMVFFSRQFFFPGLILGRIVVYMYVSTCSTIVLNFAVYIIYRHFLCMSSRVDNFE